MNTRLVLITLAFSALSSVQANAQSISGFKIGDDLRATAKSHPEPDSTQALASYAAFKWNMPGGNDLSVTASPEGGRIVFIESDWGGNPNYSATDVPGLKFGQTTLADIRERFQSNGFGFVANVAQVTKDNLIGVNCYQIEGDPDLVLVVITTLPIKDVPVVAGKFKPDSGKGHLDSVILASLSYLKEIWGERRIFDKTYHPVRWK